MYTLLVLTLVGILAMLCEIADFKKATFPIVVAGLLAAFGVNLLDWNTNQSYYNEMLRVDNYAVAFSGLLIAVTFLWLLLSPDFFRGTIDRSDRYAIIVFALAGSIIMVSYTNLIMLFLGIEILSISMYVMAGSRKSYLSSNEAALKYFLMGAFATGFLLFGVALIYGATGSFNLITIAESVRVNGSSAMLHSGILLMLVAMAFKVSAAPFHFWAPDVYQGSPTSITAFMSTIVKTAAFAAFLRLFFSCFSIATELWSGTVWVLSAATILIGNITAVYQQNIKRMLAYSSIAHAGYMMMAVLAVNQYAQGSLLFYAAAYALSSLAAFSILIIVSKTAGGESIDSFKGMAYKNPVLAFVTLVSVLSLAGIPPLAGFFAKYYIFSAALQNHNTILVIIAVIGSLIGVYYYFRILIAMFKIAEGTTENPVLSRSIQTVLILISLASLVLGLAPELIISLL